MELFTMIAVVAIVAIVFGTMVAMAGIYFEYKTKLNADMLKRGYVPKGYQPISQPQQVSQQAYQPPAQPQPTYPRYELPQLPEQGAPMPFGNEQAKAQPANLYDMPTTNISAAKSGR